MQHLHLAPSIVHFVTGLAAAAIVVLASAMVSASTAQAFDWHLWLRALGFGEAGALGGYVLDHISFKA